VVRLLRGNASLGSAWSQWTQIFIGTLSVGPGPTAQTKEVPPARAVPDPARRLEGRAVSDAPQAWPYGSFHVFGRLPGIGERPERRERLERLERFERALRISWVMSTASNQSTYAERIRLSISGCQ
jgi:hypothetical protein